MTRRSLLAFLGLLLAKPLTVLAAWKRDPRRGRHARSILLGVALSILGAVVQQKGWGFGPHFNHNDVYHVIQMGSLVFFFLGARLARDAAQHPAPSSFASAR